MPDFIRTYAQAWMQPQNQEVPQQFRKRRKSLEKIKESLVFAYLVSNLNFKKSTPEDLHGTVLKKYCSLAVHPRQSEKCRCRHEYQTHRAL